MKHYGVYNTKKKIWLIGMDGLTFHSTSKEVAAVELLRFRVKLEQGTESDRADVPDWKIERFEDHRKDDIILRAIKGSGL